MPRKVLIPIPQSDFDPTEVAVPWTYLKEAGVEVSFATPTGQPGTADPRMVTGDGLGLLKPLLMADRAARSAYQKLETANEFLRPLAYEKIVSKDFDALLLPGGHAKGMRVYLESSIVQSVVADFFDSTRPVGAICHGTLMAARSVSKRNGKSVLFGRKTTGLTRMQEMTAWTLTRLWLGDYYRTYDVPMETELKSYLESSSDYSPGPLPLLRDTPNNLNPGFTVRDGNYLSARWPGDAHKFGSEFAKMVVGER